MTEKWWEGDKATPDELRANAWRQLAALREVFHYRSELLGADEELANVATALDALLRDDLRDEVVEVARRELRRGGEKLLLGESADAVVAEVVVAIKEPLPPTTERDRLALSVARAILHKVRTSRILQRRAPDCATFLDSVEAHDENEQRVLPVIVKRLAKWDDDTDRVKAARRLVIAAMTKLGDDNAEALFSHHRNTL